MIKTKQEPKFHHLVDAVQLNGIVKRNVERYAAFIKHAPKILRESMMLAYQTSVDDCMKAMDTSRVKDPIQHDDSPKVVLLDEHGHAT